MTDKVIDPKAVSDEQVDDLVGQLDELGRDVCGYEYGLPIDDESRSRMRVIVRGWLSKLSEVL